MRSSSRPHLPAGATAWLLPGAGQKLLDLGSGRGAFAALAASQGHRVTAVDQDARRAVMLWVNNPTFHSIAAQAENLPFRNGIFDVATASQNFHKFAPGLALAEIARVLRPGGRLCVVYTTRDDTVPWVKRLARLLQSADPQAMSGDFGQSSVSNIESSPYFDDLQTRSFRNWVPITRQGLIDMAANRPAIAGLPEPERQEVLAQVGGIYDSVARPPEPLLLPFQLSCWRARVDHSQLELPAEADGLDIAL